MNGETFSKNPHKREKKPPPPLPPPSLDSRQKRLQWAHKEVDLVPHPVDGLLQAG